jgi:adenylate kinase family enzyme
MQNSKHVIVMGPPGAGKTTLLNCMSRYAGFVPVEIGVMIRKEITAKTEFGKKFEDLALQGIYPNDPDAITWIMTRIEESLINPGHQESAGWIYVGIQTAQRANVLDVLLAKHSIPPENIKVIRLVADENVLTARLEKRRQAAKNGNGEQRADDTIAISALRSASYAGQIEGLTAHYGGIQPGGRIFQINAARGFKAVYSETCATIGISRLKISQSKPNLLTLGT